MDTHGERLLRLTGTRNLRDLGGYRTIDGRCTRWRTLFRSDSLDRIDPLGQAKLIELGLHTIVDLRDDREVIDLPNVFFESAQVHYRRVPVWDEPLPPGQQPDLSRGYVRELDLRGHRLREVFDVLLAPDALPALIHCAAGKDRTGVVVALVLAAVGVPTATIVADYALSQEYLGPDYLAESRAWAAQRGLDWARWRHLSESPPQRMLMTLDYLERQHGGIQSFLIQHGLPADKIVRLHDALTERPAL